MARGYVGEKGEIYVEKKTRELSGLQQGDDLIVFASEKELVIRKIPKLRDILKKKPLAVISAKEMEEISEEIQKEYLG